MESYAWTVGVDQGPEEHVLVVVDAHGGIVAQGRFAHGGEGIRAMVSWVERETQSGLQGVAVATETPWGPVVEAFLASSAEVFHLNPKQLDRFRDRFSVAGAKNDPLDAQVLGSVLATDRHHFRRVSRPSAGLFRLRRLGRLRDRLVTDLGRAAGRLRAVLLEVFPDLLTLCTAADERWLWSLLEKAPTPQKAQRLQRRTLHKLLRVHRIRRFGVEELRRVIHQAEVAMADGQADAALYEIGVLLAQLRLADTQLSDAEQQIKDALDECAAEQRAAEAEEPERPTDVEIVRSQPGIGPIVASTLLGEAAAQLRDHEHIRKLAGAAPVGKVSGRSRRVSHRRACNQRLQDALYHWGRNARNCDPHAARRWAELRARGHSEGRALRQLADGMLAVLAATLRNRELYDPDHPRRSRAA